MSADAARLLSGMRAQLARRDEAVRDGGRQVGWKLGFGSPSGLELLGLDRPLLGFLLEKGLVPDAGVVDIAGWAQPMLEPEIAVHLRTQVEADASWDEVQAAISGYSAAIELADIDEPPEGRKRGPGRQHLPSAFHRRTGSYRARDGRRPRRLGLGRRQRGRLDSDTPGTHR